MPKKHSPEKVEEGLMALALWESPTEASKACGVPAATLTDWREKFPKRYLELRTQWAPQFHEHLATKFEDIASKALHKAEEGIDRLNLEALERRPDALAQAAMNMAKVAGMNTDNARKARDMPTVIVEQRDTTELVSALKRLAPGMVVEGTAVELPPGQPE